MKTLNPVKEYTAYVHSNDSIMMSVVCECHPKWMWWCDPKSGFL